MSTKPLEAFAAQGDVVNDPVTTFKVIFQPNGRQGEVPAGTILLDAARDLGVEIESICGGHQTCSKCKVQVEEGDFAKFGVASIAEHLSPPGAREQEYAAKHGFDPGMRMSCACEIVGDVVIRVPDESQTRKQVVRKAAGIERHINVDAPMRLYYVELAPASMKDHRGDWERLRAELYAVHGLEQLAIDIATLRTLQQTLGKGDRRVTVTVFERHDVTNESVVNEVVRVQPGFHDDIYGMAVDVGTTTVAGHLCNLRTGEVLASSSRMNPQVPYGEDLMSRISYVMMNEDGTERMHAAIIDGLNELAADVCEQTGITPADMVEIVIVGNTTMHHLVLGVNPVELGGAPFSLVTHNAVDVKARDLGLNLAPSANAHFPPSEAGHVGADNVGVLVAEAPYLQDEQMLAIDIGTNGEILLGNRARVLSASSPTGPAFEGAQIMHGMRAAPGAIERVRVDPATLDVRYKIIGDDEWIENVPEQPTDVTLADGSSERASDASKLPMSASELRAERQRKRDALLNPELKASGICGSGIIEAIAELFIAGVIGPNGRFVTVDHPRLHTGLGKGGAKAEFVLAWPHETSTGRAIVVHSDDIRAIQLGKAALYAGTKLLMERMELDSVDRIALAGGFGSYIDPIHAMILGLIPNCNLDKVAAVGNAAGDGARMILLDKGKRAEVQWAARWVDYIETAVEPAFQDEFVRAIEIPHATDPFPAIQPLRDSARAQWANDRRVAMAALQNGNGHGNSREARSARRAERINRRKSGAN